MIVVALGANLPSPAYGPPRATLEAALADLEGRGLRILRRSRWYETAPVPVSDQPWFVNGVAEIATGLDPAGLLAVLHETEARFGRTRQARDEARIIDLDIVDFDGRVETGPSVLPHPRLAERGFVLLPLAELAPDWRHPATGRTISALVAALPRGQQIRVAGEGRPAG